MKTYWKVQGSSTFEGSQWFTEPCSYSVHTTKESAIEYANTLFYGSSYKRVRVVEHKTTLNFIPIPTLPEGEATANDNA